MTPAGIGGWAVRIAQATRPLADDVRAAVSPDDPAVDRIDHYQPMAEVDVAESVPSGNGVARLGDRVRAAESGGPPEHDVRGSGSRIDSP